MTRLLLDACVLYPTVLRQILLDVARSGVYRPLYSARILEEWRRAAARGGDADAAIAAAEIAVLRADWPAGEVTLCTEPAALSLPDPDDIHVFAAALEGRADAIVTHNLRDFPGRTLARHGLSARSPDSVLLEFHAEGHPVRAAAAAAQSRMAALGRDMDLRVLLKRAGLPRLGKALTGSRKSPDP
ncbi:MAG: PIN domain-containing protein [Pseudomonadota bacterium]